MATKTIIIAIVGTLAIMALTAFAPAGSAAPIVGAVLGAGLMILNTLVPLLKHTTELKRGQQEQADQTAHLVAKVADVSAQVEVVRHETNSLTDRLVEQKGIASFGAGVAQGKADERAEQRADTTPPRTP